MVKLSKSQVIEINDPNYLFKCSSCKILKLNSEFDVKGGLRRKRLYHARCKGCMSEHLKIFGWGITNPEKRKLIQKKYNLSHKKELQLGDFGFTNNADTRKILSFVRIKQLERYFNQGWIPNWSNSSECKYYLWYEFKICFWVFGSVRDRDCGSGAEVGFYKTEKIAKHIQNYFNSEYLNVL